MTETSHRHTFPKTELEAVAQPGVDCWRDGEFLVLRREAAFSGAFGDPDPVVFPRHCCAKCGGPVLLPARRYFLNWYPTWIFIIWISVFFLSFAILSALTSLHLEGALFLGLLCSIFALAVSGVIFGNAFMTDISFCVDHQWRWWMVPSNLAIMALTIMVLIVVFGLVSSGYFWHVYPYWLGMPAILVASARSLLPGFSVTKTNEKYVYIKGCGEAFLASLPQIGREEHKNA